jgi:hypothetical protein
MNGTASDTIALAHAGVVVVRLTDNADLNGVWICAGSRMRIAGIHARSDIHVDLRRRHLGQLRRQLGIVPCGLGLADMQAG